MSQKRTLKQQQAEQARKAKKRKTFLILALCCAGFLLLLYLNNAKKNKGEHPELVQTITEMPNPTLSIHHEKSTYSDDVIDSIVDELLETITRTRPFDEATRKLMKDVVGECSEYSKLMKESFKNIGNLKIDFIAQLHWDSKMPETMLESVKSSQSEIRFIMDHEDYDAIGYESSALDKLTLDSWNKEQDENAIYEGRPVDPSIKEKTYHLTSADIPVDAIIGYLFDRKTNHIIGTQSRPLWLLNLNMPIESELSIETTKFRSFIALARMVKIMKENNYKTGCLVLGSYHAADLISLANKLGFNMDFYDCCHDNTFGKTERGAVKNLKEGKVEKKKQDNVEVKIGGRREVRSGDKMEYYYTLETTKLSSYLPGTIQKVDQQGRPILVFLKKEDGLMQVALFDYDIQTGKESRTIFALGLEKNENPHKYICETSLASQEEFFEAYKKLADRLNLP